MASRIGALGAAALAIACCAGLPAIAAALGGLTAAALAGLAAGLIAAVLLAVAAFLFVKGRRHRARTESRR